MTPTIDKVAWIHIKEGKILSTRSKGKHCFYLPGGKREGNETDHQCLTREIREELSVQVNTDTLHFIGTFSAQADSHPQGVLVKMRCYSGDYQGELKASAEIAEYRWLSYQDREHCSAVDKVIFDHLYQLNRIR